MYSLHILRLSYDMLSSDGYKGLVLHQIYHTA